MIELVTFVDRTIGAGVRTITLKDGQKNLTGSLHPALSEKLVI